MSTLVTYFSAQGRTKELAEKLRPYLNGVEEEDGKLVRSAKELSDWK